SSADSEAGLVIVIAPAAAGGAGGCRDKRTASSTGIQRSARARAAGLCSLTSGFWDGDGAAAGAVPVKFDAVAEHDEGAVRELGLLLLQGLRHSPPGDIDDRSAA